MLASSQFLFDTGMNLEKRNSGFLGILSGALGYVLVLMTIHTAIILYFDKVYNLPIVTLYFASEISFIVAWAVSCVIFVAMYAASSISMWSISGIIRKKFAFWRVRYVTVIVILGILGLLSSSFPFRVLVNFIYPINGIFGLLLVFLIMYKNRRLTYIQKED